jgi:hypothetical protein
MPPRRPSRALPPDDGSVPEHSAGRPGRLAGLRTGRPTAGAA